MTGLKKMSLLDAQRAAPAWLRRLLETDSFFEPCPEHPAAWRSTRSAGCCNFFCTTCAGRALCSRCLGDHAGHETIQIRKSSSHCLVKVEDLDHLLNVSQVQTYVINGEPAVFLDKRTISGKGKPGVTRCEECSRGLHDAGCLFCSLGCKAKGIEDRLDFSISFAVYPRSDSSGEESESASDEEDSSRPTKSRKI
ncbi:hypothetical protein GQ55_1G068400 [Panicum hallii var. hallii]|uniref:B box-type domain-containing protein n=1 Tax=Panicum hallii var. hallii TaxID=1504633 RepID=A0A2T7F327_9POAL|nr:hypothetical protein GQ55_1G068400 [Panicum hallii var. hallii]